MTSTDDAALSPEVLPWSRRDLVAGLLVGLPVAIPAPPFYLFAVVAFLLVMPTIRAPRRVWVPLIGLIGLSLLSAVFSPYAERLGAFRVLYSSLFFGLFLFGFGLRDRRQFVRGFLFSSSALALAVIGAFFLTGQQRVGPTLWVYSMYRNWGTPYFPDWPNYLAFSLAVAALLHQRMFGSYRWAGVCALGAVLTTSRTGMLGALILFGYWTIQLWRRPRGRWVLVAGVLLIILLLQSRLGVLLSSAGQLREIQSRLSQTKDRLPLYQFTWGIIREHPLLGVGHIVLEDEWFGAPKNSFHNAYLEILARHGVFAFLLWLALLVPPVLLRRRFAADWPIMGYFLLASVFNTLFKQPHIYMMYSVLVAAIQQQALVPKAVADRRADAAVPSPTPELGTAT